MHMTQAMRLLFRKPRHRVVDMLKCNPGLVFMSPRIIHNKLKVGAHLQYIKLQRKLATPMRAMLMWLGF
jgi:hypothetical protein